MSAKYMTIIGHLDEIRKALLVSIVALIPAALAGWYLRDYTLALLIQPLKAIDPNFRLQILGPADKIFVDLKIAVFLGIIFALPIILWQVGSFFLPALKQGEKRIIATVVPVATILFVSGIVFAYFTVFQMGIQFFFGYSSSGGDYVQPAYTLTEYIGFAITFLLPFGFVFELPIVVLVLTKLGVVTPKLLSAKRKYAVLIIFVIAAFLTPGPDIISQLMMAVPMYVLFEVSILLAFIVTHKGVSRVQAEGDV